jgi:hypothetical protein
VKEAPIQIESREELVYLLGQASEIEHGLLCEYIYAQFSLKRSVDEGVTEPQLERIKAWEQTLIDIAKQEMLHLALATNILTAVGAAPHFERPNFPILCRWYPDDVRIALLPFGEQALRHFMFLERPEGMPLSDVPDLGWNSASDAAGDGAGPRVSAASLTGGAEEWHTVGHLYRGIEAGLAHLVDVYGEDEVFIGPQGAQVTTDIFEWPELMAVTDLASASAAIEVIVEQGEGARGDWVDAHFGRFVGILEDYRAVRASDPSFEPARPVLPAFVRAPADVESPIVIEDDLTRRMADLFNALYHVILQLQARHFVHHGETPEELDTVARTVKHAMNWVMRGLGPVLTRLPIGPRHAGRTAGPAFETVTPAQFVLPHRQAAWRILRQRFTQLASATDELARDAGLTDLPKLADDLRGFAHDFTVHLDARAVHGEPAK